MAPLVFEMFMGTILITTNLNLHTHTHTQHKPSWGEGSVKGSSAHHPQLNE